MNCSCDYLDPPSVYEKSAVSARKAHKCCECGQMILPGEIYIQADGLWDGAWGHYKTCHLCEAYGAAIGNCEHGGLWDAWNNDSLAGWRDVLGPELADAIDRHLKWREHQ